MSTAPQNKFSDTEQIYAVLQTRRGKRDNLGIIFHIAPLKRMLHLIIRTVLLGHNICFYEK